MLLLNTPPAPPIVNDAARAVNRIDSLEVKIITPETLTELLGIEGMLVTSFALEQLDDNEYVHLFFEHEHSIAILPCSGEVSTNIHDTKDRSVRHLDIWDKRTIIHFTRRRFECAKCKKTFTENLSWIDPKRRQTRAFEKYIYECLTKKKMTRRSVAQQEGLHEATVLKIFKKWAKEVVKKGQKGQKRKIRVLGIDEIYLGKKKYVLVISDIERRCVIKVLPNRLKKTLEDWFDTLSEEEGKSIKVVSMDMWEPYRSAARHKLPHASIVADRFHVMKQLNRQLDLLRRNLRANGNEELAELLKKKRWILLKNRSDLSEKEEAELLLLLAASEELYTMYLMKEEFRMICEKINNRDKAERFLRNWLFRAEFSGIRYLKKFAKTLRNWWEEFLNYFDEGVTQGFVEGINRAIRGIINRAFGYHKFYNFRRKG
jgi:transposase